MTATRTRSRDRGMAIGLVMWFVVIFLVFATAMIFTRSERKRQTRQSFNYLKAHFLAQGAIQHALLKIRVLPNEIYDASSLQRGLCPFYPFPAGATVTPGTKDSAPMDDFRDGVRSEGHPTDSQPIASTAGNYTGWKYEIAQMEAVGSMLRAGKLVHVIEITARAEVPDPKPGEPVRVEVLKKTVEIEREVAN